MNIQTLSKQQIRKKPNKKVVEALQIAITDYCKSFDDAISFLENAKTTGNLKIYSAPRENLVKKKK